MPRLVLLHMLHNPPPHRRLALLQPHLPTLHHKRHRHLARALIRHRNHRAIRHGRMRQQMRLQLSGRDLQALDLDELLDAVDDEDVLVARGRVAADEGLVARAHPAVLEGLAGGVGVVEVAERDRGRLDEQLAGLVVAGDVGAVDAHQARFDAGEERAAAAGEEVMRGGGADDGAGLGEAVALADGPGWVVLVEFLGGFFAERGGAGEDGVDAGEVVGLDGGEVVDHVDDDGRHEIEGVDFVVLDGGEEGFEFKAREDDDLVAAVKTDVRHEDQAIDVGQRKKAKSGIGVV